MRFLNLEHTQVTGTGLHKLAARGRLQRVVLDDTRVGDAGLKARAGAGDLRTGMIVFALLRWLGTPESEALELINTMRPETREGMREQHLIWGNKIAAEAGSLLG